MRTASTEPGSPVPFRLHFSGQIVILSNCGSPCLTKYRRNGSAHAEMDLHHCLHLLTSDGWLRTRGDRPPAVWIWEFGFGSSSAGMPGLQTGPSSMGEQVPICSGHHHPHSKIHIPNSENASTSHERSDALGRRVSNAARSPLAQPGDRRVWLCPDAEAESDESLPGAPRHAERSHE